VFPTSSAQVAEILKVAAREKAPVVTRGSGTGLSGGSVPVEGSVILCLVQMNRILELDARNLTLRVEPGVITQTIDETVNRRHLNRPFDRVRYIGNLKRILDKSKRAGRFDAMKQNLKLEIIYGLPGETYEGFEQTFDFVISELEFSTFFCIRFEVLPGSYFWEHAHEYQLVYEKEAPHYLISSPTFSRKDMDRAVTLVFFYNLFDTILKGVQRVVDKNIRQNKLRIYKRIIQHISQHYPEFVSSLYRHFDPAYIESGFREKIDRYLSDKRYIDLRYQIIREARDIVMRHRD
jgi:hypothetical protein